MPQTQRSPRREVQRAEGYEVHIVGAPRPGLRDLYHALLRVPWWAALLTIVGGYLALNALFALGYLAAGGVANMPPGSYADAFFFSVQTMGTIGYGSMYPTTRPANILVVAESVVGLVVTALATGLVFVRFSQTRPRVVFSRRAALSPMDGVPTLAVRLGNERANRIVDVTFRMTIVRTTRTAEGVTVYRSDDLALVRGRAPALSRSWMILHRIVPGSPLHGETPESLAAAEAELTVEIVGTDDTSLQPIHAHKIWMYRSIAWGARLTDVLSETPDGNLLLDLTKFDDVEPTEATEAFPYRFLPPP
jgi:inward rectifier potassium channel